MKKVLIFIISIIFVKYCFTQSYTPYSITSYPVTFKHLQEEATVTKDGARSYTVTARGGEEYYITLFKASARFNADSLKYMLMGQYSGDNTIQNIQVNEVGSGKMGNLDAERARITFMYNDKFYTATAVLVRFHINRKFNSFLLNYEMSERSEGNGIRYDAVKSEFEKVCSSFEYTEFKYTNYFYDRDSIKIEYPDFWFAGKNDTAMIVDDGRCGITVYSKIPFDTVTTFTYLKCEKDAMKKKSALYPGFKSTLVNEKIFSGETITKHSGSYEYEEFGGRKNLYFEKYVIRRKIGTKTKDFHILLTCPEMYLDFYRPKFDIIFKSILLPGKMIEVKK